MKPWGSEKHTDQQSTLLFSPNVWKSLIWGGGSEVFEYVRKEKELFLLVYLDKECVIMTYAIWRKCWKKWLLCIQKAYSECRGCREWLDDIFRISNCIISKLVYLSYVTHVYKPKSVSLLYGYSNLLSTLISSLHVLWRALLEHSSVLCLQVVQWSTTTCMYTKNWFHFPLP